MKGERLFEPIVLDEYNGKKASDQEAEKRSRDSPVNEKSQHWGK